MDPALSVVVPSVNGWTDLVPTLEALDAQRQDVALEVLVPERCGPAVQALISERFAWVRVLPVAQETSIPQMRALAFDAARAPSVAVIEDHVHVPRGWAKALLAARATAQVVGGAVVNTATGTVVDEAAFLVEYGHLLPPLPRGPSDWITGNNTVYDRALLNRHRAATHSGRWENHLHHTLREEGVELTFAPDIVVAHQQHLAPRQYLFQRFLYSKSFAGQRLEGRSRVARLFYGAAALGLPAVLFGRTLARLATREVSRRDPRWLPWAALFCGAWGAGEVAGALFGAGDATRKVR